MRDATRPLAASPDTAAPDAAESRPANSAPDGTSVSPAAGDTAADHAAITVGAPTSAAADEIPASGSADDTAGSMHNPALPADGPTADASARPSAGCTPSAPTGDTDTVLPSPREQAVRAWLDGHGIVYTLYRHPASPTIELARQHWRPDGSLHCKNLFFRNHKGDRHYLVCFDCAQSLAIRDLEQRLRQGKLTFASPERMMRYLGLEPGSVSPFGLINDTEHHVHLFLDEQLRHAPSLSFHPNDCRATVVLAREEFERYLALVGNSYEYLALY